MRITATGVYGNNEETFFSKLIKEEITLFIDIRQRRLVRGSKYKFVNSKYLQEKLNYLNIKYLHRKDLAPTTEIRNKQKIADKEKKEKKQDRQFLSPLFVEYYSKDVLENFNFQVLLDLHKTEKIVLFCVEEECCACHRSLVIDKLRKDFNLDGYCF